MRSSKALMVDLLFVGGGHSHAIALREFAMDPLPGVSVTLISDRSVTPYSGMLPGYLAGKYTYDECHIDLRQLMEAVGGQFLIDQVTGIHPESQTLSCDQHPDLHYDWLSVDIGSTPIIPPIPGALEHGIPVKPWQPFLDQWSQWTSGLNPHSEAPINLIIVGGGGRWSRVGIERRCQINGMLGLQRATDPPLDDPCDPSGLRNFGSSQSLGASSMCADFGSSGAFKFT